MQPIHGHILFFPLYNQDRLIQRRLYKMKQKQKEKQREKIMINFNYKQTKIHTNRIDMAQMINKISFSEINSNLWTIKTTKTKTIIFIILYKEKNRNEMKFITFPLGELFLNTLNNNKTI